MKNVTIERWAHINAQPPLWQRDPKNITDGKRRLINRGTEAYGTHLGEYILFYNGYFKDFKAPLSWSHFSGVSEDGVAFKAILYLPSHLPEEFWQKPLEYNHNDLKLLVKRTFITSDLGEYRLPKWASWVKIIVDGKAVSFCHLLLVADAFFQPMIFP